MAKRYPAENGFTKPILFFIFLTISVEAECTAQEYYDSGECISCPTHCSHCNPYEHSFLCDTGYSGGNCAENCDNCKPDTKCTQFDGFCEIACRDGLGRHYCHIPCASNCKSCLRNNITRCLSCKNNNTCEIVCPNDCLSQICNGSKRKRYSKGCPQRYWGESCTHRCPKDCNADISGDGVEELDDRHHVADVHNVASGIVPIALFVFILYFTLLFLADVLLFVVLRVVLGIRRRLGRLGRLGQRGNVEIETGYAELWANNDYQNANRVARERNTTDVETQAVASVV